MTEEQDESRRDERSLVPKVKSVNEAPKFDWWLNRFERVGLGWINPFLCIAARRDVRRNLDQIIRTYLLPLLAFALFLFVWSIVAQNAVVRTGTLPGPYQVYEEAVNLWNEHVEEGVKEREFYAKQDELKARYLQRFPDREWVEHGYAGKDTFIDQIFTSLYTEFFGFMIASVIAVPIGLLCGMSQTIYQSLNPLIQIFKPVSPLAWLPMVMIMVSAWYNPSDPMFEKAFLSSAIVVALCSLWPTLINTANGVVNIDQDYLNVAKVLKLGWFEKTFKIVIPAALPYIFTGLRLSLGIGWMVLIAAEMLAQNPGLGKFVWDMFQNGSSKTLAQIMVAVFTIGIIGFLLDRIMIAIQRWASYEPNVEIR
ncbi:MAG: ABC transporter permease subunit [bacterium]|nr:ABC transporter permease subunit [bacterium]